MMNEGPSLIRGIRRIPLFRPYRKVVEHLEKASVFNTFTRELDSKLQRFR